VSIQLSYISAERFWELGKPLPKGIHISTNVNVVSIQPQGEKLVAPYVVTINYSPSVAQMSLKGRAILSGDRGELEKIREEYEKRRTPPIVLLQSITGSSLVEATLISRSLHHHQGGPVREGGEELRKIFRWKCIHGF